MIPFFALDQGILPSSPTPAPEGMFSLSYRIEGQIEAPVMSINPAGPLAPGLLRKLFLSSHGKVVNGPEGERLCFAPQTALCDQQRREQRREDNFACLDISH